MSDPLLARGAGEFCFFSVESSKTQTSGFKPLMVSTRLWLGGVISPRRDKGLIQALADKVRGIALCRPLLVAVDGLPSYVKAFQRAFRTKLPRHGQRGRARWRAWSELTIVQVVKNQTTGTLVVSRRIVQGCAAQVQYCPDIVKHSK